MYFSNNENINNHIEVQNKIIGIFAALVDPLLCVLWCIYLLQINDIFKYNSVRNQQLLFYIKITQVIIIFLIYLLICIKQIITR